MTSSSSGPFSCSGQLQQKGSYPFTGVWTSRFFGLRAAAGAPELVCYTREGDDRPKSCVQIDGFRDVSPRGRDKRPH